MNDDRPAVKKILAFSFFPAFVPPSSGGEARLFNFYRALSRTHQVTLLSSGHRGETDEWVQHGANFVERRVAKDAYFDQHWAQLQACAGAGDLSGPCVAAAGRSPTRMHQAYLELYADADVIIHDSPFTIDYDLFAGADAKPRLYNAYNCESELYRSLHAGPQCTPLHQLVSGCEQRLLQVIDVLLYCSDSDRQALRALAPQAQYAELEVANGTLVPAASTAQPGVLSALFMGSAHAPNVEAARFIVEQLAPALPDVRFDILGNCLAPGRYPANVVCHGLVSVERKQALLQQASIALNPMVQGSGSNVKVFDYMAHGLPLLSTAMGMRGVAAVAGEHYLQAEREQFARVLGAWPAQAGQWQQVAAAGQALVLQHYTWDRLVAPVLDYLQQLPAAATAQRPVLVLNDYNSFTAVGGGATRTRGLYAAVQQWCPVLFICFSHDGQLRVERHGSAVTLIAVPRQAEHQHEQLRVNSLSAISADDILACAFAPQNPWLLQVYNLAKDMARAIVVEHPYMAGVPLRYGDRFVYSSQNNETLLKQRLFAGHPEGPALIEQVRDMERAAVQRSAAVVAVSEDDAHSLTVGVSAAAPVCVVRNGAEPPHAADASLLAELRAAGGYAAVFLGSGHPPNIEALHFILGELAPACPQVQFHVIGSVCGAAAQPLPANVRLWGVLDDAQKSAVLQASTLAINPMSSGSGSNVKLADFLGNGLFTLSSEFGQRGYAPSILPHVRVAALADFAPALLESLQQVGNEPASAREARRQLFAAELSMQALGREFVSLLQGLEQPRKRVLLVTYRYVAPALGGAEAMIEQLLRALDGSEQFDIDVVAAQASGLESRGRFSDEYRFAEDSAAFTGLRHTRFARFPVDRAAAPAAALREAWLGQCDFEREVYRQAAAQAGGSALGWGWSHCQDDGKGPARWAFNQCGVHLAAAAQVRLQGTAINPLALLIQDEQGRVLLQQEVRGDFDLQFAAPAGEMELFSSLAPLPGDDPRPLAFLLQQLWLDGQALDLRAAPLCEPARLPGEQAFEWLHEAGVRSRSARHIRLTDLRGPWSSGLEAFIEQHVGQYDLLVTHNTVFRPAVVAVEQARRQGVPSIVIPHVHLDDDFYHFPDVLGCAQQASRVLAAPRAACEFLRGHGCAAVDYLPAGIDSDERFSAEDVTAFRAVYDDTRPFVLVLGRKAGAKGYQQVLDTVAGLPGRPLQVVMIGPDDDGVAITTPGAVYLGRQPRAVVRGALLSCLALVNMSSSESFGIVLLEAWMAGKPVVVNRGCAAFHDMAVDQHNALLVDAASLAPALLRLLGDSELCTQLAANGREVLAQYDWRSVGQTFVEHCRQLSEKPGEPQ